MSDQRKKLSDRQVRQLRKAHKAGKTIKELAKYYKVGITSVWAIVHGLSHKQDPPKTCPHCHAEIP